MFVGFFVFIEENGATTLTDKEWHCGKCQLSCTHFWRIYSSNHPLIWYVNHNGFLSQPYKNHPFFSTYIRLNVFVSPSGCATHLKFTAKKIHCSALQSLLLALFYIYKSKRKQQKNLTFHFEFFIFLI